MDVLPRQDRVETSRQTINPAEPPLVGKEPHAEEEPKVAQQELSEETAEEELNGVDAAVEEFNEDRGPEDVDMEDADEESAHSSSSSSSEDENGTHTCQSPPFSNKTCPPASLSRAPPSPSASPEPREGNRKPQVKGSSRRQQFLVSPWFMPCP